MVKEKTKTPQRKLRVFLVFILFARKEFILLRPSGPWRLGILALFWQLL